MILFEWDERKAATNLRKHGIRFDEAALVFFDEFALAAQDRVVEGEPRWQTIGMVEGSLFWLLRTRSEMRKRMKSSASSLPGEPPERSALCMSKAVKKVVAEIRRSPARKRELTRLALKPDEEIDLSEMPELGADFWKRAVRNPFYKPVKKQITLRLDADVIAWLRRGGKGYQTKANAFLREMMVRDVEKAG